MSLRVHTVRGLFWSGLQRSGAQAISVVSLIVLSRLLDAKAFGLMALANAFLLAGNLLVEDTINQAVVQRTEVGSDLLDTAFALSSLVALAVAVLTLGIAGPVAGLFGEPLLAPMLWWLSLTFLLTGLRATQTAILQRRLRFQDLALRSTLAELVAGGIGVAMALGGFGVWSLVGQSIGRAAMATLVLWRVSTWRPRRNFSRPLAKDLVRFGLPILGDKIVSLVRGKADDLIIGLSLGATSLGYYAVGYRVLVFLSQLLSGTVQAVVLPVLARLKDERERMSRAFLIVLRYLSLGAFPVFVGVALVAPTLVPILFGAGWEPSIPVMSLLAVAGVGRTVVTAAATLFVAMGRPGLQLRINAAATLVVVVGFVLVVERGIDAVAWVHLCVNVISVPVVAFVGNRALGFTQLAFYRSMWTGILGVAVMAVFLVAVQAGLTVPLGAIAWLVIQVSVGAAIYFLLTFALDRPAYGLAHAALREGLLHSSSGSGLRDWEVGSK